ncbi:tyrosine-type recombinase/integrase [Nannocystis radixulma]|uniref:Tyrosine-type recombinase/integrase n=1 Tax=Nannocystis radixulma TaxID=2995305 RepID=A0ABT5BDK5_9BACT|nr:tyrosine-type recombinase/integrase [Nannocystis radixulma]MDC0672225.1 tyrosine-type recombinase/integrase [Nannocystis radixulma]
MFNASNCSVNQRLYCFEHFALRQFQLSLVDLSVDSESPPPTPRTMVALKEMRRFRSEFVFADEDGRPWTKRRVEAICRRLYRSVGVRHVRGPPGLRHAAIQRMSLAGVPLDVIRQITGHADFRILQEYLHDDVEATGMVGSKLANYDFTGEVGGLGEILEKLAGAEVHIHARARRGRGWLVSHREEHVNAA